MTLTLLNSVLSQGKTEEKEKERHGRPYFQLYCLPNTSGSKKITRMDSDKSFVLNFVTLQSCLCQYVKERRKIKGTKNKRLKP